MIEWILIFSIFSMKIVIDIDWTISTLKKDGQTYAQVEPNFFAIEKIKKLKEAWHYIILQTARHMETCSSNVWLVNARVTKTTLDWLEKYDIPYDEIYFWKPNADVYLDDNAKTYLWWDDISDIEKYDEKVVNVVIPMAGAWSRFAKAWYDLPKPLIDVKWYPMFYWASKSFDFLKDNFKLNYIFIVLKDHIENYEIDKKIKVYYPESEVISLDRITRWQAETVLMARNYINDLNKLVIFNSDTYTVFDENDFPINDKKVDWLISCFNSDDKRYSFAKLDDYGYVKEVAEKVVISNNANNWMYYFRKWVDFVKFAEKMIRKNELSNWEFYVWPMYTDLINSWKRVKINSVKENWILWTPEELDYFLSNYQWK